MADFNTVTEELRQGRLEQKKLTSLTEKLLAEKRLDDTAKQIFNSAIPEVVTDVRMSNKVVKANKDADENDKSDVILKSLLQITYNHALASTAFFATSQMNENELMTFHEDMGKTRTVHFQEMFNKQKEFAEQLSKEHKIELNLFKDIKKAAEETAKNVIDAQDKFGDGTKGTRPDPLGADKKNAPLMKFFSAFTSTFIKNTIFSAVGGLLKKAGGGVMKFFSGKFPKMIFSLVGGLFSKTIGFIGGLLTGAKDFLFKIGGGFYKLLKSGLNFFLKPFKLILGQAGNIFGGILTIVLLGALVDFLRSPLWKNNKDGIAALIGEGIQFTLDGVITTFNILTDYFMNTFIPAFDRFIYSFLDSPIVRGVAKVSGITYSDELENTISLKAKGGIKDQIKKIEDEVHYMNRTGPYLGGDRLRYMGNLAYDESKRPSRGGITGDLRMMNRKQLEIKLDDLKSQLPAQREITRNIKKIIEQTGGSNMGAPPVVMTNDVRNDVTNFTMSQKTIMQYGSSLIQGLIQSWR